MKRLDTTIPSELSEALDIICEVYAWTKKDAVAQAVRLFIAWANHQTPDPLEDTPSEIGFRNECG